MKARKVVKVFEHTTVGRWLRWSERDSDMLAQRTIREILGPADTPPSYRIGGTEKTAQPRWRIELFASGSVLPDKRLWHHVKFYGPDALTQSAKFLVFLNAHGSLLKWPR